ncbi:MAG: hypothetical protein ACRYFR_14345 [Janthinobacterium lividum]
MNVILYIQGQLPQPIDPTGYTFFPKVEQVLLAGAALGCMPSMVDVLASGPAYLVYMVFDSEAEINEPGMLAAGEVIGTAFDAEDDDQVLRGPVLVVKG